MSERFLRNRMLLGPAAMERLAASHVCVVGLGGVGGYAAEALARAGGPEAENLWIIGGGSIYAALLSRCRRVYLTRVETRVQESDTFFPNLDKLPNWEVASEGEPMEEDGMKFRFLEYVNTKLAG